MREIRFLAVSLMLTAIPIKKEAITGDSKYEILAFICSSHEDIYHFGHFLHSCHICQKAINRGVRAGHVDNKAQVELGSLA